MSNIADLVCSIDRSRGTGYYVAHCPLLDIFSQGPTREGAAENLLEAMELFLGSCGDRGVLEGVFLELSAAGGVS